LTHLRRDQALLEGLIPEVIQNVRGRRVLVEGEDDDEEVPNEK